MPQSPLRRSVIRLAASLGAAQRQPLLALLKESRRGQWKTLFSGPKVRVRFQEHPNHAMWIEELSGKPFKRRLKYAKVYTYDLMRNTGSNRFMMENLIRDASLSNSMSFDQVVSKMKKVIEDAKKAVVEDDSNGFDYAWFKANGYDLNRSTWMFEEGEINYLQVEPADYNPVILGGNDWNGTFEWTQFTFYADREYDEHTHHVEGQRAFYRHKSPGGARKLFKLIKADPEAVKRMSLDQFTAWLNAKKVAYDWVPTYVR